MAAVVTTATSKRGIFRGWWVVVVLCLATFFIAGSGGWTLTILMAPMGKDLSWSHAQILGVLTLAGILGAVVSPFVGKIADMYGARALVTFSLLFLGATLVLTGWVQSLWQFYLLYGVGEGLIRSAVSQVGCPTLIAHWFVRKRGIALAAISAASNASGIVAAIAAQSILDQWNWRLVWIVIGIAVIIIPTPLSWLVIRRRPEDLGLQPDGDGAPSTSVSERSAKPKARREVTGDDWTLGEALHSSTFWLISAGLFLTIFAGMTVYVILGPYFRDLGISSTTAAVLVSYYAFASLVGSIVWGGLTQWFPTRKLLVPFALVYGGSLLFLVTLGSTSVPMLFISLMVVGIAVIGNGQLANLVWPEYYGKRHVGSIIGSFSLLRNLPASMSPLFAGMLRDTTGSYKPVFGVFVVACLLAGGTLLFARPPKRKAAPREAENLAVPRGN